MKILESLLSAEFVRSFAWTLLHSVWQGAIIALITAGVMLLMKRYRPVARYAVLYILLILMPIIFVITFISIYKPSTGIAEHQTTSTIQATISGNLVIARETGQASTIPASGWLSQPARFLENHADWLVLAWFIGFLLFLLRFTGSVFYIYRLRSYHLYPTGREWERRMESLSFSLGIKRKIRLAESALAHIPMTVGYLKPVILLPLGTLSGVPPQQLDAILLHELAHILRRDYLLNLFQSVVEMLFFYHPVTWWLSGLIREEREHICDDLVVAVNQDHINYIKALTIMEEINLKSPKLAHALAGPKKKLLFRVKRLLAPAKLRNNSGEGIIAFVLLIGLVFVLSLNALSFIPNDYDLSGRESGERVHNLLGSAIPALPAGPDTIIATSKSGKVIVQVYTDSTDHHTTQRDVQVFVDNLENHKGCPGHPPKCKKEVVMIKKFDNQPDSMYQTIIIKSGDSVRIIQKDTVLFFSGDNDSTLSFANPLGIYEFDTPGLVEIPERPPMPEMPDFNNFNFNEGQEKMMRGYERQMNDYEQQMKDMEIHKWDLDRQQKDERFMVVPHDNDMQWNWSQQGDPGRTEFPSSEKIIRQELFDNGLVDPGRKYIIEIGSKGMYINGEKQPKETWKKYKKLVEGLDNMMLVNGQTYKLIF
jgi:bla regulator protein blaR1